MISVSATFKWNDRTKLLLQQAPEKILRQVARQTLDYTGSTKVTARDTGKTEQSMYTGGVKGDYKSGFYIGNFTDYASYVYPKSGVNWTNPNTQTKWFEYTWTKYGKGILDNAVSVNKL